MTGIIEKVPARSQTDNNYNSIVNSYIGWPGPAAEHLIRRRLAGTTAGSGLPIVLNNTCINFFYLTPLPDGVMLLSFNIYSMSVRFSSHLSPGGKEVMIQDIIGCMPILKPAVGSGHDLQWRCLPESVCRRSHQGQVMVERIFLNPQVEEEKL
jgi:hypothetical protein